MATSSDQPGFVKIDFARYFPHKFWISDWSEDDRYPWGFRYKVLGVRDEKKVRNERIIERESPPHARAAGPERPLGGAHRE